MHPSYNKSLTLTIAIQDKTSRRRQALKELNAKTQEWIPTRAREDEVSSHHALNIYMKRQSFLHMSYNESFHGLQPIGSGGGSNPPALWSKPCAMCTPKCNVV